MRQHPIYVSDTVYQLLVKRATQESRPLEQVADRLLTQELSLAVELDNEQGMISMAEEDGNAALAAVHRLTSLFADVEIDWLEQALNDPMLELANVHLEAPWL